MYNAPIATKPIVFCCGWEDPLFSDSNEMFLKVKVTVGVGSLHHLSNVLKCTVWYVTSGIHINCKSA